MRISTSHLFLVIMDYWTKVVFTQLFFKMISFVFVHVLPACMCVSCAQWGWMEALAFLELELQKIVFVSYHYILFLFIMCWICWRFDFWHCHGVQSGSKLSKDDTETMIFFAWIFNVFSTGLYHRAWLHVATFSIVSLKDGFETGK